MYLLGDKKNCCSLNTQVASTSPEGQIRLSTLLYSAQRLVSTQQQCRAPCP